MTVSTERSASRACDVSSRKSDSGVVMRMSAGSAGTARARGRRVAGADGDGRDDERLAAPAATIA